DTLEIIVYPEIDASFVADPERQILPNSTVSISNNTNNPNAWEYAWDFGDEVGISTATNPAPYDYGTFGAFLIQVTVSGDQCVDVDSQMVFIEPIVPIVDFDADVQEGCGPLRVNFTNLSQFTDPNTYMWDFGDGQGTSTAENPSYTYNDPGVYAVSLSANNDIGLEVTEIKDFFIEVFDSPQADFVLRPDIIFLPDNLLFTSNRSKGATIFFWEFGDGNTSDEFEPTHAYQETGIYDIVLVAENDQGCVDTLFVESAILVERGGQILVPNAFSPSLSGPNGGYRQSNTGVNDVFLPVSEGVVGFNMLIYNRWGELLYESNNRDIGWDGYSNGKLAVPGVYVYRLILTFANGEVTTRVGDVTLIR
ncbi:MAG: PKD domain-containing protein, partial [Bacteroidetes bacterium]|nr:PKD domain-containing protein [Bacteroidota bacterium]